MRISDWSSDVCSSDLQPDHALPQIGEEPKKAPHQAGLKKIAMWVAQDSTGCTPAACAPFGPCVTSSLTRWPSCRLRKPLDSIAEKCTKTSALPSSGAMKPKHLASLNHFTVPYCMSLPTSSVCDERALPCSPPSPRPRVCKACPAVAITPTTFA